MTAGFDYLKRPIIKYAPHIICHFINVMMKKRLVVVVIDLKTGSAGFDEVLQRAHPTIYRLYTRYIYVNVFYNYLKRVNDILLVIMCVVCMRARNIMVRTFLFNIALCD